MAEPEVNDGEEAGTAESPKAQGTEPGELARRVQWLFETKRRPDGKRYSQRDVARTGSLSPTTVSRICSGENPNPSMEILGAFAKTFGVPFQYFDLTESAEQAERRARLDQALETSGIEGIALRSMDLKPESLELITNMLDRVRAMEGLPPIKDSLSEPE